MDEIDKLGKYLTSRKLTTAETKTLLVHFIDGVEFKLLVEFMDNKNITKSRPPTTPREMGVS